ncbi:MAG: hypothetical protein AAB467_04800 [Patescibacteria group bacterium]
MKNNEGKGGGELFEGEKEAWKINDNIRSSLSHNYLVYGDYQKEQGRTTLTDDQKFLEFIGTLNPAYTKFFNQRLEENLKLANPDGIKKYEELQSIFADYENKLASLRANYSLPITDDKEAIVALQIEFGNNINYREAKRLGLEVNIIRGSEAANRLLQEVIGKTINITTKKGQKAFVDQWKKECPNLPMPCVPPNDFWYLTQISQSRIISNLEVSGQRANQPAAPHFEKDEVLLVDNWTEQDYSSPEAALSHQSKLLEALLGTGSTVNISREIIDNALWEGDPSNREPTEQHQKILKQLNCDPKQLELRLIRQDEYARLAPAKQFGQKNLWTNFDNYFLEGGGVCSGLNGGFRAYGGPSRVDSYQRVLPRGDLAVRLVLSRKQG